MIFSKVKDTDKKILDGSASTNYTVVSSNLEESYMKKIRIHENPEEKIVSPKRDKGTVDSR